MWFSCSSIIGTVKYIFPSCSGMLRGDQPYSAGIPKEVANRIRRVLSDNPDGILLSKFSTVYKVREA